MTIIMNATMLQNGRGGIYRYVDGLSRSLAAHHADVAPTIAVLLDEAHLLAGRRTLPLRRVPGGAIGDLIATNWRFADTELLHVPSYRRVPLVHRSRRLVATVHDLAPLHMPEKYGWARYHFIRDVVPHTLRRCDHLLCVTEHTRQDLITSFGLDPQRVTVSRPGIDHMHFMPGDRHDALARLQAWQPAISADFVCYTARIEHPGKGHMALIDAWAALQATRGTDLPQLVFAGAPCERADEVIAHASKRSVPVLITGFVPEHLLPDCYRACSLFVFPSRYEGFGLPPVEAMACGAPVAASRAAALAETAGPAATLDPDDPEQMAASIANLLDDSTARCALASAGMNWAARFTWHHTAAVTARIYRHVLGHSAHSRAA